MPGLVTSGVVIPGICGPFGILFPIRLRARIGCRAANGKLSLGDLNKVSGKQAVTMNDAIVGLSPMQMTRLAFVPRMSS